MITRVISARVLPFIELMRLDKPIGIYLLLFPTLTALWIASGGFPGFKLLIIFTLGVVLTRSAGCVINDLSDMKFDGWVSRTKNRPLVDGRISKKSAVILFIILIILSFILVLQTNTKTIYFSFGAVILMSVYPIMKRFISAPQFILGVAFSWAVPMAFTANNIITPAIIWLIIYIIAWAIVYDTMYAMVDKPDDLKIGVKSTAILFAPYEKYWIAFFQLILWLALLMVGVGFNLSTPYFIGVFCVIPLMIYHQKLIKNQELSLCFKAFLHNHWIGFVVFIGTVFSYL